MAETRAEIQLFERDEELTALADHMAATRNGEGNLAVPRRSCSRADRLPRRLRRTFC